jgi:hypothetical protein
MKKLYILIVVCITYREWSKLLSKLSGNLNKKRLLIVSILVAAGLSSLAGPLTNQMSVNKDTGKIQQPKKPLKIYNAVRLTTAKPKIDGVLNDSCWKTGEWSGDFTQWIPNEGGKPSQPTEVKLLYDDKSIYVAIRAFDSEPGKIHRKAGRRDELPGDAVGVTFDSYHDHRTGFEFDLTAAGQKTDLVLTNPLNADFNWNAVWYGKVGKEDSAWTAEMEIPLNQLRYSNDYEQVWGMHCWRFIDRLLEESDWEVESLTGPGMLYLFGEIHGIKGLKKARHIELMPYALGKLKTFKKEPDNPFSNKGRTTSGNIGLDAKLGVASNFTVDLTINPDFGQVEADPSVMNLTAFETFYDEKRPFFLEGKNIFSFDFDDVNLFYSRRIGHSPTYRPNLQDNEYMKFPDYTTILSSEKLSGKTSKGLSIGVIHSITAAEHGTINSPAGNRNFAAEPLTNYLVARVQQDINQSNTMLGGIFTATNRFIHDDNLNFMNREAYTGGLDLLHQWKDKEYYIDTKIVGSEITGKPDAIRDLQLASARYYQRPDADHLSYDSTLTRLSGYGGKFKIGKGSKGLWRYNAEINWRSPGLDLNDIGFMQTSDLIKEKNVVSYFVNKPVSIFRTYNVELDQENHWDFGLKHLSSAIGLYGYFEFLNKWGISPGISYNSNGLDTRLLRGGEAMKIPASWSGYFNIKTDASGKLFFNLNTNCTLADNNRSQYYALSPGITAQPFSALKISMNLNYSKNIDNLQYVDILNVSDSKKYILGKIDQQSMGITLKIDLILTPEITLQYYGSPFASIGKYSDFKLITNPKANVYNDRFFLLKNPAQIGSDYQIDENNDGVTDYTLHNPDFSFYQFRSNLVFRWEYKPGSQIYLVWSNERTDYINPGANSLGDTGQRLSKVFPNNIFLIKFNYWFSL